MDVGSRDETFIDPETNEEEIRKVRVDNRRYYVQDSQTDKHLGSNRVTIDTTGTVLNAQDYYAFGEILRSYNNSSPNERYYFTGKERDTETNLDYFGARYYDSEIGRWLNVDPLADEYPGWSGYNYCMNNTVNAVDPDGRVINSPNSSQPYWGRTTVREAMFSLIHPGASLRIGLPTDAGNNISSMSQRFANRRSVFSAEEVNAVRHTVWQATITKEMGSDVA